MFLSILELQGITEKSASLDRVIVDIKLRSIIFAVLVIAGAAFCFIQCREETGALEIRDAYGQIFGKWPIDEPGVFAVEFIHSVNQTPVRETFRIDNGNILLDNVRFNSFGAGMQSDLYEGMNLIMDTDAMIISGFSSSFKELNLIVGTVSDHILYINNEVISLRELCGRNAQITLQYR